MIPALGPQEAADLQREMTRHVLARVRNLSEPAGVQLEVWHEGGDDSSMRACFGSSFLYRPQPDGDLGQRLARAFDVARQEGIDQTVVIGADCPGIEPHLLQSAFAQLDRHDLVLGPAADGGYYLVGLRQPVPRLFTGIDWGTDRVLRQTLAAAAAAGLSAYLIAALADVDRPEDLAVWQRINRGVPGCRSALAPETSRISVVIPTLDEGDYLDATLDPLQRGPDVEMIVADGGSRDRTVEIARARHVRVVDGPPGRARQMNLGAAAAGGDVLLFLHADTHLPQDFPQHVHGTLAQPGVVAGAFRFRIAGARGSLRLIQWATNLRSRLQQMPYGDQALFLRADTFFRQGGFADLPIMEDYDFVQRLRRIGRIALAGADAVTSGRRWNRFGPWRTTLLNQQIIWAYRCGVSPSRLARWYRR